jgi:hypothetical protein
LSLLSELPAMKKRLSIIEVLDPVVFVP